MRKIFTLLSLLLVLSFNGLDSFAGLSPYSAAWLNNHTSKSAVKAKSYSKQGATKVNSLSSVSSTVAGDGVEYVGVFVKVASLDVVGEIESLGAIVDMAKGSIVAARVPVDKVVVLSEMDGVIGVEIERKAYAKNDMARVKTNVDDVHSGAGDLTRGYKGSGVLVGVCDQGIDFNNISFKDENGISRVKRAYLPDSESGVAPTLSDGTVLSGSVYETPIEIAALTTDTYSTHGTHVTGIAAGSYMGNDFYGMAPESDLILCGVYSLTDYNLVSAVSYAMDQADRMNKPISVNLSIGNNYGSHDGTSYVCQAFDELVGAGKILSMSAGNEGNDKLYVSKEFTATDKSLKTLFVDYTDGYSAYGGYYDMWSRTSDVIGVRLFVYDFITAKVVYESKVFMPTNVSDLEKETIDTKNYPELAKYYDGTVEFYSEVNDNNNKYNIFCNVNMTSDYFLTDNQPDYCLGVEFIGDAGEGVDVWIDDNLTYFSAEDVNSFEDGTPDFSINSFSMGKNTISVGSYDSKTTFKGLDGYTYTYSGEEDEISFFSSYAPLSADGEFTKPDIVAPGALLVSSVNSYDSSTIKDNADLMSDKVVSKEDGREYYWKIDSGTSMASPVVTGTIALWLEADRTLTHDKIKAIFKKTAIRDKHVTDGDPRRWGYGKIDAYAGLVEVIKQASVEGVVDDSKKNNLLIYNQRGESFDLFVPSETDMVKVNIYDTAGGLLFSTIADGRDVINVDASGRLGSSGVKIVQVVGSQVNYSTKIIFNK